MESQNTNRTLLRLEEKLIELGYERYNDTYNFGKVKGTSINTNVVIQDINLQQAYNIMKEDLEEVKKYV